MKIVLISIMFIYLVGCSSAPKSYPTKFYDESIDVKGELVRKPNLNSPAKVEIGENMYEKSYLYTQNTYTVRIVDDILIDEGKDRQYGWLVLGLVGAAIMEGTAGTAFNFESKGNESFGLLKWGDKGYKAICNSSNNCLVDVSDKGYFTHYGLYLSGKVFDLPEEIKYEMTLDPAVFVEDSFKYVVLYQGVTDNKVKISFREFYEDRARPAFSQDIYYDLDPSGKAIIGFKGLRIAIEEATNFGVRYRVIEDYN